MTVACGGGLGKVGTDYEQLIAKLMAVEGEVGASFWKDPVLLYTREPLVRSLTTLPSEDLQKKAIELFKVSSRLSEWRIVTVDNRQKVIKRGYSIVTSHLKWINSDFYCSWDQS